MSAFKTFFRICGVQLCDYSSVFRIVMHPEAVSCRITILCQTRQFQSADIDVACVYLAKVIIRVLFREQGLQLGSEPFDVPIVERVVSQCFREIEVEVLLPLHHRLEFQGALDAAIVRIKDCERIACRSEIFNDSTLSVQLHMCTQ